MKPQDFIFFIILIGLLWKRNPLWAVVVGLLSLFLAAPLFQLQVFFTAERLLMYACGFLLSGIVLFILENKDHK